MTPLASPKGPSATQLPSVGVHVLRHSAAAALIQSGASATAVQKILGHRSAAFTLTVYGHIFDTDLDLVAENLDQAGMVSAVFVPRRGSKRLGSE